MARETDADVTTTDRARDTVCEREKIADPAAGEDETALELSGSWYGYIGRDAEGAYHHMDKRTMTVFVTPTDRERFLPDDAGLYWFRVSGPVVQSVCLEDYEDKDIQDWKLHVAEKRGWDELPVCPVDKLNAAMEDDRSIQRVVEPY
ncbi:hypothetical protein [Natronorubrum sp. DTA7]|uniref:hypothetical protein n=1 Tax=Natronorubrum sp. DTA7 TaxID=3447016 RepID=UPI003F84D426